MTNDQPPVHALIRLFVAREGIGQGDIFEKARLEEWFASHYPDVEPGTIRGQLTRLTTNAPSRIHHAVNSGNCDLFYKIDAQHYRLYERAIDPPPIYRQDPVGTPVKSVWGHVKHDQLRHRLQKLGPDVALDTVLREAGVVLEDTIRMLSKSEPGTHGVDLVDRAFDAKKGTLRFSQHSGEQEGAKLLYRGAIMFIRNPPMHRLVQYAQRYAEAGIELIDALLQLLEAPDREDC